MGFYLRKGVKVGPLRFNLSKSGIGVSAGIKGLRFGSGPRGNCSSKRRARSDEFSRKHKYNSGQRSADSWCCGANPRCSNATSPNCNSSSWNHYSQHHHPFGANAE